MTPRKRDQLREKVFNSRFDGCSFTDFQRLIEAYGFEYSHKTGSHMYYHHPTIGKLDVQARKGKAKWYQIEQFIDRTKNED